MLETAAIGQKLNGRFRNNNRSFSTIKTSNNGHYLPWSGKKIIRNQESVAVRQIDLPSQLFLKPTFLSDICTHIYDQASLNVLTGKSTRPDYWGVIVVLALGKTAPASSRLSAATSIAKAKGYYELR